MDSIYRDAYPGVFSTFEDDYEHLQSDIAMQRLEDSDKEDVSDVETV